MLKNVKGRLTRKKTPQPVRRRAVLNDPRLPADSTDNSVKNGFSTAFRRNRTITGSLSSSVSTPNEREASLKSPRVQEHILKKKRHNIRLRLLCVVLLIAVIVGVLSQTTLNPVVHIVGASPETESQNTAKQYGEMIERYMSNNMSQRLVSSTNSDKLTAFVQTKYPEVENISLPRAHTLFTSTFDVTVRQPVVYWQSGNTKAFVDSSGVVFSRNVLGSAVIPVDDQSGIKVSSGNTVISSRFLQFIGKTIGYLKSDGYTVSKIVLPANTTRQLLVSIDGLTFPVKMSVDRPSAGQVEDATRAIKYLNAKGISAQYIDVRVSRRAYYK